MAGLANDSSALQQWQRLFAAKGLSRSPWAKQHWQQVLRLGLPTRRLEAWKYTPLEGLLNNPFVSLRADISSAQCDGLGLGLNALRIVFVNGVYSAALSDDACGSGFSLRIDCGQEALPPPLQPELFLHLTESLSQTVTHILVARNQRPTKPLLLLHITQGTMNDALNTAHYRHHLTLGEGAEATVIEHFVSLGAARHFSGARLTMQVGANARLHHIKLAFENAASYHFSHNDIQLAQDALADSHSFLLGCSVLRHHTSARFNGENAALSLNSLAMPGRSEVCDTRSWLDHRQGYCTSRQLHKTIVNENGRAVFNGLINVAPLAIKTDGQMTNNNLLLGKLAEVDTKPQLEIYADDVKCSHGATVGRIDEEQLFYLRARGIDKQAARRTIIYAFAAALTEAVADSALGSAVLERVVQRLPGGAA